MLHFDHDQWLMLLGAGLGGLGFPTLCYVGNLIRRGSDPSQGTDPPPSIDERDKGWPQTRPDELEGVEGIGPQIAALLRANQIRSFADLAGTSPDRIRTVLRAGGDDFGLAEPASWPLQAELLRSGRISDFLELALALRAGTPRLEDLIGVGKAIGEDLRESGYNSLEALERASPADLVKALAASTGRQIPLASATSWIAQAAAFQRGDRAALWKAADLPGEPPQTPNPAEVIAAALTSSKVAGREWWRPAVWLGTAFGDPNLNRLACAFLPAAALLIFSFSFEPQPQPPPGGGGGDRGGGVNPPLGPEPVALCKAPKACLDPQPLVVTFNKFPASRLFAFSKDIITPEGAEELRRFLKARQDYATANKIDPLAVIVVGHTDRIGDPRFNNQGLSERRAEAVEAVLKGAQPWSPDIFHTYGRGSRSPDPAADNIHKCALPRRPATEEDKKCYEEDRRVEVTVLLGTPSTAQSAPAAPSQPPTPPPR